MLKRRVEAVGAVELDHNTFSSCFSTHDYTTGGSVSISKCIACYTQRYMCTLWNVTGACKRQRAGSTTRPASLESRERRHIPHAPQKQPRNTHPRGYFAFLGYARSRSIDDLGGERRESGVGSLKLYLLDVYVPSQEALSLLQETGEDCYIDSCIDE